MADSNIEEILKQLLDARFGKDVRQAIHDGIEQCYEDGKVGAVDLVARQQIANLVANGGNTDKDSELLDIRVGKDSITYTSAGEAVRSQFDDTRISSKDLYYPITLPTPILGAMGTNYSTPNGSEGYRVEIPVKPGEKYMLTGYVYNSTYPLAVFFKTGTNEAVKYTYGNIDYSISHDVVDYEVTVPENVDLMVVNAKSLGDDKSEVGNIRVEKRLDKNKELLEYIYKGSLKDDPYYSGDYIKDPNLICRSGAAMNSRDFNKTDGVHGTLIGLTPGEKIYVTGYDTTNA